MCDLTVNDFSAVPSGWMTPVFDLCAADPQSLAVTNANGAFELIRMTAATGVQRHASGVKNAGLRITSLVLR